ncbi:hypothetical protein ACLOJK_013224 [Asimina triloba]
MVYLCIIHHFYEDFRKMLLQQYRITKKLLHSAMYFDEVGIHSLQPRDLPWRRGRGETRGRREEGARVKEEAGEGAVQEREKRPKSAGRGEDERLLG